MQGGKAVVLVYLDNGEEGWGEGIKAVVLEYLDDGKEGCGEGRL